MSLSEHDARDLLEEHGQEHVLRFWDGLSEEEQALLLADIGAVDFELMERLIRHWILRTPEAETFDTIEPVPCKPVYDPKDPKAREAWDAGEETLRAGNVGLFLVAGGQGTRLGFDGPKGAYPVGPISGRTLFEYHADKIHALQRRYGCVLPWYIMVSDANEQATRVFFEKHDFFGLESTNVQFLKQRMVPCVDAEGKFFLESAYSLAKNPNGHGGCLPAMVENGVIQDAHDRGLLYLSYFQVDNWAVKIADPYFIGHHVLQNAEMSSKNHRKQEPREAVGVHCLCDGEYRVIEYTELDIYPQLLETDDAGNVIYYAGNPAIHILSTEFVGRIYQKYDEFPWHCSHKKIPHLDDHGNPVEPDAPNGYKFETFVFDALRFAEHELVAVEIAIPGEYTPIKQYEGPNSVVEARRGMSAYWAGWIEAAGGTVPRDKSGQPAVDIEISPAFAFDQDEFVEKSAGRSWPTAEGLAIGPDGTVRTGPRSPASSA